jgi:hypothetical protein
MTMTRSPYGHRGIVLDYTFLRLYMNFVRFGYSGKDTGPSDLQRDCSPWPPNQTVGTPLSVSNIPHVLPLLNKGILRVRVTPLPIGRLA